MSQNRRKRDDSWLVKAILIMGVVSFFLGKEAFVTEGEPQRPAS